MRQLRRMLPVQGELTERMARLRATAHHVREGHVGRLAQMKHLYAKLSPSARKEAAARLVARYQQLVGIEERVERLDKAVATIERRIKELTGEAQARLANGQLPQVPDLLKAAEALQRHNGRLLAIIERTESRLSNVVRQTAQQASKVSRK